MNKEYRRMQLPPWNFEREYIPVRADRYCNLRLRYRQTMKLYVLLFATLPLAAQQQKIAWTAAEQPIYDQIHTLRSVPDDRRPDVTKGLALRIRDLPLTPEKGVLAQSLANLATEGDPGHQTLQEVASTLAASLREHPEKIDAPYLTLAQLVRYEHVNASLDTPPFRQAMSKLEAEDSAREHINFTLTDMAGKTWILRDLKGKVVLVNFWATWCPPCRKEMPDLDSLYKEFRDKGLVVLAISDEESATVASYLNEHRVNYPILLDPGRKVTDQFIVHGIPKTFVYDRAGHLAAQSIDMRTRRQFLEMLRHAGL
jgi:peroxiredoxin